MRLWTLATALVWIASAARADEIPRPEHPNPQFQRDEWRNLNGAWDFWEGDVADEAAMAKQSDFPDRITVPFCRESKLSGLGRTGFVKNVLYRRTFTVPKEWGIGANGGARLLLHVGACDWRTTIWVNGVKVGFHEGGSTPIDCDATDALALAKDGVNELRLWAFDDTASGLQQSGKQSHKLESFGCVYTRTTGIWQTVWMERVGSTYVDRIEIVGHCDGNKATVVITPHVVKPMTGWDVGITVRAGDRVVGSGCRDTRDGCGPIAIVLDEYHGWAPGHPFLYDVAVDVVSVKVESEWHIAESRIDHVASYFGLRRVACDGLRVLLNMQPVFQRLILDQGFYPDGIWTAPSDAALKRDIELSMAAGFNGARLHQKVFEPRFLYWADQLGYLVWGETPSWGANYANPAVDRVVLDEWRAEVERDRNHPSIVGWCPFNETDATPGRLQNAATALTRALDPTRPVLDTSGYVHSDPQRDVDDAHDYDQDPASFRARWWPRDDARSFPARYHIPAATRDRPFFVSEFGGIGWIKPGEPGEKGWSYGDAPKTMDAWMTRFQGLCDAQLDNPSLFGFCYTQLTDVEQERNGLYYYDRTPKFDVVKLHAIVSKRAAIEANAAADVVPVKARSEADWRVVVPSHVDDAQRVWSYVALGKPLADDTWRRWATDAKGALDGAEVETGRPGFGAKGGFEALTGTPWKSPELYLMRTFDFDGAPFQSAALVMHYDNAAQICLNGEPLLERAGWNDGYEPFDVTARAKALLKKGANTITVHVHQDSGGQFFDAALLLEPAAPAPPVAPASPVER